ncbi:MAG: acyltransferase [Tolypothrix carrinoi HA7290-LM1]|jgi:peptidoglycan/LPS O-acetylase OafA/YrhL|nr:acyltransferase [Tolypothrix carrinoi HA7290-LM1]
MNSKISSTTSVAKPKVHFYFIDALRGIAALWVVFYHTDPDVRLFELSKLLPNWFTVVAFKWGSLGVSIFFVLSGFVIAYSLREAKIDFGYFKRFSLRRLTRLSPPYYVAIIVALGFAFISSYVKHVAFAPMGESLSFERLLTHLFYLQGIFGHKNIDDVYWTLCLEVQFYLVFCALLAIAQWLDFSCKWRYAKAAVFVSAATVAALFPLGVFPDNGRPVIFLPLWYAFLLGVFAYWSWRDKLKPIFFYLYAGLVLTAGIVNSLNFAIASAITAILILEAGRANRMEWLNWRWLQFLGKISYSLYLTHVYLLGIVFFLGYKILGRHLWSEILCLVLGIAICIGFAAIMWQLVEKPSIKLSQKVKLVKNTEAIRV